MSITAERKKDLMQEYAIGPGDVGSVDVQCAVLTERINNLTTHFKSHHKDHASKRGLLMLIGTRRRLLDYLKKKDHSRYIGLIAKLGIRK